MLVQVNAIYCKAFSQIAFSLYILILGAYGDHF